MIRILVLVVTLSPFAFYAWRDTVAHFRLRKPGWKENVIHLVLAIQQVALVIGAFRGSAPRVVLAGAGVAIAGAIDEWGFHRGLPAEESDIHAKAHFALFGFAMVALVMALFSSWDSAFAVLRGSS